MLIPTYFSGTVQVSATLSGGKSLLDSQTTVNGVDPGIMVGINTSIAALALSAKDKQVCTIAFYLALFLNSHGPSFNHLHAYCNQ